MIPAMTTPLQHTEPHELRVTVAPLGDAYKAISVARTTWLMNTQPKEERQPDEIHLVAGEMTYDVRLVWRCRGGKTVARKSLTPSVDLLV